MQYELNISRNQEPLQAAYLPARLHNSLSGHKQQGREERLTNVGTGCETQTPNQASAKVTDDVTIQVGHDQHIKLGRVLHQLHACIVHNHLLVLNVGVLLLDCRHSKKVVNRLMTE